MAGKNVSVLLTPHGTSQQKRSHGRECTFAPELENRVRDNHNQFKQSELENIFESDRANSQKRKAIHDDYY